MNIKLSFRNERAAQKMLADLQTGARPAVALACNKVADQVQSAVRASLPGAFTLRRKPFIENTIYRNKATDFARWNQTPVKAIVRVNPERDYLAKHEEGGDKTALSGSSVAIPLKPVRPTFNQVVRERLRLSALRSDPNVRKVVLPAGTFLVRNVKGRGKAQRGARTDFLYQFKRSVRLRPRLGMMDTFTRVVERDAIPQMMDVMKEAIGKAIKA